MMKTNNKMQGGVMHNSDHCSSSPYVARGRAIIAVVGLFSIAFCPLPLPAAEVMTSVEKQRQELIEIMKGVNFVPQLGEDNPICKSFYEDFKKQTNIEYIQPIVKAETYDDPALKPYRDKCPEFDFRKSLSVPANQNTAGWTDEDWESLGTPTYGMGNFQFYRVDMDNNPKNGEELVFYYEGERTIKHEIPVGGSMIEKEYINLAGRGYRTLDLKRCKGSLIGGAGFNQLGSAQWTRNGIIRYKGKNAIFMIESAKDDRPDFRSLSLHLYSEKIKRTVPTCTYRIPR
jgi:hypothetical protein